MEKLHVKIKRSESNESVFTVSCTSSMTVLNILEEIQRKHDPALAYRFSCSTGLCATCMIMINGRPELSCMKIAAAGKDGFLSLAPLPKGETIKDLVKKR